MLLLQGAGTDSIPGQGNKIPHVSRWPKKKETAARLSTEWQEGAQGLEDSGALHFLGCCFSEEHAL